MKKLRKIFAVMLALCCALSIAVPSLALVDVSPFDDVSENAWYYYPAKEAYDRGLMLGIDKRNFGPDNVTSRAMAVTVLWRAFGVGSKAGDGDAFADVEEGKWYTKAVAWAAALDIARGRGDGRFYPHDCVTRAELCVMICRAMDAAGYSVYTSSSNGRYPLHHYRDYNSVPEFSVSAMVVLSNSGIVEGNSSGRLEPLAYASRAETAAIVCRAISKMVKTPVLMAKHGLCAEFGIYEDRMPTFTPSGLLGNRTHVTFKLISEKEFDPSLNIKVKLSVLNVGEMIISELKKEGIDGNKCVWKNDYSDALELGLVGLDEDSVIIAHIDLTVDGETERLTFYTRLEVAY